jgi:hypothetical protein
MMKKMILYCVLYISINASCGLSPSSLENTKWVGKYNYNWGWVGSGTYNIELNFVSKTIMECTAIDNNGSRDRRIRKWEYAVEGDKVKIKFWGIVGLISYKNGEMITTSTDINIDQENKKIILTRRE